MNKKRYARDYQVFAAESICEIFDDLDSKKLSILPKIEKEKAEHKRVTLLVSPTASGKTIILSEIKNHLQSKGFPTLVLTHLSTVAKQNREAGLTSTTIQNLFYFIDLIENEASSDNRGELLALRLGLPENFFKSDICVCCDESHWGLMAQMYNKVLTMVPNVRMIVGFTATPKFHNIFNTIDITPMVRKYIAHPLGSVIHSFSIVTLPFQLSLFPKPTLVFTQNVASAALIAMVSSIIYGEKSCIMIVGSGRSALESYAQRFFEREKRATIDESAQVNQKDKGVENVIFNNSIAFDEETRLIDRNDRRFGFIVLLLLLNDWKKRFNKDKLLSLLSEVPSIPTFTESLSLITKYLPHLKIHFKKALDKDPDSIEKISRELSKINIYLACNATAFEKSGANLAVSVFKISTGFDYPEIRTVVMAESVADSKILYKQRAGRGARKTYDKSHFDLVDVRYLDPLSELKGSFTRVNWMNAMLAHPQQRRKIENQDVIVREECHIG